MEATNLDLKVRDVGNGIRVVDISGEITSFSEDAIAKAHAEASPGAQAVILNFEQLNYMNSGGIGLLVTTLIRAQRAGHALRAYGLSPHYQEIFNLTRLDEAISIYPNEAAAIEG